MVGGDLLNTTIPGWFLRTLAALYAGVAVAVVLRAACTTGAKHDAAMAALSVWLPLPVVVNLVRRHAIRRGGHTEQAERRDNNAGQSD